jgi:hypothetical protein
MHTRPIQKDEEARDHVRALMGTPEFEQSSDERKKVEMRFALRRRACCLAVPPEIIAAQDQAAGIHCCIRRHRALHRFD